MRAGLAAVFVVVGFMASSGPRTLAQDTKPTAPGATQPGGAEQANPPDKNRTGAGAPSTAAAPAASPEPSTPAAPSDQPAAAAPGTPDTPPASSPQAAQTPAAPAPESPPPQTAQPPAPDAAQPPPPPTAQPPASAAAPPEGQSPPSNNPTAPPAANAPPATNAPATPAPPPTKSVLDKHLILGILGKDVKSAKGEDMGRIVDVIVDRSGQTRAAIIDFGGFLGVGSRRIAVDWNALHFAPLAPEKDDQITLDLTRDQVKSAPEYKEGKQVVVLGPSGATETMPYD